MRRFLAAIACMAMGLSLSAQAAAQTATDAPARAIISLDSGRPGRFVAWAFNYATISGRDGFSGPARLYGGSADGTRLVLFETRLSRVESIRVCFYAWPDLSELFFEGLDAGGAALSASLRLRPGSPDPESARLQALPFSYRRMPPGGRPRSVSAVWLEDGGLEMASRRALSVLFAPGRRPAALVALALWTAASVSAAFYHKRKRAGIGAGWPAQAEGAATPDMSAGTGGSATPGRPRGPEHPPSRPMAVSVSHKTICAATCAAACVAACVAAGILGAAKAELYSVYVAADPATRAAGAPSGAESRVANAGLPPGLQPGADGGRILILESVQKGSYTLHSWKAAENGLASGSGGSEAGAVAGGLYFMALRSPLEAAVPVSAFDGFRRVRFKVPPLVVTGMDGHPVIAASAIAASAISQVWGLP